MAAEICINNPTFSASSHTQSVFLFGEKVLSAYREFYSTVIRRETMDGAKPVHFDEFLNFMF